MKQILHANKQIHFPSGYPIARSPPLFVCSSPGPDPYRSLDNVYEELGPPNESDVDSDQQHQSDDDFAEDELSLNGRIQSIEVQPIKSNSHRSIPSISANLRSNASAILIGQPIVRTTDTMIAFERNSNDRNSLLSSSSTSTAPVNERGHLMAGSHSTTSNSSCSSEPTRVASPDSGLALNKCSTKMRISSAEKLNSVKEQTTPFRRGGGGECSRQSNQLSNKHNQHGHHSNNLNNNSSCNSIMINNFNNNNNNNNNSAINNDNLDLTNPQCDITNTNQLNYVNNNMNSNCENSHDVNLQNQINKQIISTICPNQWAVNTHIHSNQIGRNFGNNRSRTNPRTSRNNRRSNAPSPSSTSNMNNVYSYAEPYFQYDYHHDVCPPVTTLSGYRTLGLPTHHMQHHQQHQPQSQSNHHHHHPSPLSIHSPVFSPYRNDFIHTNHGQSSNSHDSSFGSDSGYSQYMPNNVKNHEATNRQRGAGSLNNMLSWTRRKHERDSINKRHTNQINTADGS